MKNKKRPTTQPKASSSSSAKEIGSLQNQRNLESTEEIEPLPKDYDPKKVEILLAEMRSRTQQTTPTSLSTTDLQNLLFDPAAGAQDKD